MTFAQLKQELSDRGFAALSDARLGTYINAGRAELDRMYLWAWREAFATGLAPLAISDFGTAEAVTNTSQTGSPPLAKAEYRSLLDIFGDLSTVGTPTYYYLARPSSTEIATFPTSSSDIIGVQYWKVTPDLVNASDVPASPSECHYVIVDLAARQAYLDSGDFFSSSIAQDEADRKVQQLLVQYPPGFADGPDFQQVVVQDF